MERLRVERTKNGLTQKEMASFLGLDRTTYVKYETGQSEPNFEVLKKIAERFNVTTDYLLGRDDPTPPVDAQLSDIDFALSGEIRELSDDEKQDILDYVRFKRAQKRR